MLYFVAVGKTYMLPVELTQYPGEDGKRHEDKFVLDLLTPVCLCVRVRVERVCVYV